MSGLNELLSRRTRLLAILLVGAFFCLLGSRGLNEPDEGRYAEIAREMVTSGDWLTPHLNGFPHFQKPPIIYWATATSFKLFGFNEWAARLPSTFAALGILLLTYWMGRALFGAGALAALVLASSIEFFVLARILTPDMTMAFFITSAMACLVKFHLSGDRRFGWLFFVAMGLGFLTKGPMSLLVPSCAALGLNFGLRRNALPRLKLRWSLGIPLALLVGLSWFIAISLRHRELLDYFVGDELIARVASKHHGRSQPWWFFIPVILVGFLPWSAYLYSMVRDAWKARGLGQNLTPVHCLLIGWIIPPFLVLSISGSKLLTYVLPLFPAFALTFTAWWHNRREETRTPIALAAGSFILLFTAAFMAPRINDHLDQQASIKPLTEILQQQPDLADAALFVGNIRAHSFEFYLQRVAHVTRDHADIVLKPSPEEEKRLFTEMEDLAAEMTRRPVAYGVIREKDFGPKFSQVDWRILGHAGDYILIGRTREQ